MERLPNDPILKFKENTLYDVRKAYGLENPETLKAAIDHLEEWVQKQNHFRKKDFSRDYLERTLIFNKGSVEKSKKAIDKMCTLKGLTPKYFVKFDYKEEYDFKGIIYNALLPKVTENHSRIFILKNVGQKFKNNVLEEYFKALYLFVEYVKANEYSKGFTVLLDYSDTNLTDLAFKMSLMELKQVNTILLEAYRTRLDSLNILSSSKVVDIIVTVFKQALSDKLSKRIKVHSDLDSLHKSIPKDLLPSDYGGPEKSMEVLHDEWVEVLTSKEATEFRDSMASATTDEALRPEDKFNEEYMGMPGSFRSFNLD